MNGNESVQNDLIKAIIRNQIGYLQFVNPLKHNALPQSAWQAIPETLDTLTKKSARAIIVCGQGLSFCAGADISEFDAVRKNVKTAQIYEKANIDAFAALRGIGVPTIAKIRGYCLGGGFGLAAACDLRLADETAVFGVPAAKLGLGYPVDAMKDIVGAIGVQNTKRLLYTAQRLSSKEMSETGFLMSISKPEDLDLTVQTLAEDIAALAPLTHSATKTAIAAALGGDLKIAIAASDATFTSADYLEGRNAFKEKRQPRFSGK